MCSRLVAARRAQAGRTSEVTSCSTTSGLRTAQTTRASQSTCSATCRFEVTPGQRVGIVGATGAGKTTLINLLLRFYDVSRGRITVDGVDVRELDLDAICAGSSASCCRTCICSRARSPTTSGSGGRHRRTSGSDARRPPCTPTRSSSGCRTAIDTAVAERGSTLSVGQKQLLSFARALAFDPRVLILDEATSSVDTETEMLIRDALHVLMAGRTTIAIAHRLSTIQDMDKILVLHKGHCARVGHAPGAARPAGDLLQAVRAAVQGSGGEGGAGFKGACEGARILPYLISSARDGSGADASASCCAASRWRNRRSTRFGVLAFGFQPRRRTLTEMSLRPSASASLQLHM